MAAFPRRRSVAVTGDQDQAKAKRLSNLANALQARHGNGGSPAMLEELRQMLEARGFVEGSHAEPGHFVIEKAFVER